MRIRAAEKRLRAFVGVCQSKRTCEHTGGPQPTYRLEHGTMRILAEFPQQKEEDEDVLGAGGAMERKQVRGVWGVVGYRGRVLRRGCRMQLRGVLCCARQLPDASRLSRTPCPPGLSQPCCRRSRPRRRPRS